MHNKKQKVSINNIYKELKELYSLHTIQQEALWTCYDENKDYGHIFALDNVYKDKFLNILNSIKKFV